MASVHEMKSIPSLRNSSNALSSCFNDRANRSNFQTMTTSTFPRRQSSIRAINPGPEGTLTYTYDAHGNVLTINSSNANGASLTYTYDALNRLASAKDNRVAAQGGSANPTTYTYDQTGNLFGYVYPNTVQTANVFDPLNRLTQTCSATNPGACSAGTKLSSYLYGLRVEGNHANVTELNGRFVGYQYDNDYRLIQESINSDPAGNNGTVNYTQYDPVGNRQTMTSTRFRVARSPTMLTTA